MRRTAQKGYPDPENVDNPIIAPQDYDVRQSGRVLELQNRDLWIRPTDLSWHFLIVTIPEFLFRITVENHSRSWKPETKPRSRRLWKIETRSGSQLDGISHLVPGLLHPHLLPGENEAQTRHMSKLSIPPWVCRSTSFRHCCHLPWCVRHMWDSHSSFSCNTHQLVCAVLSLPFHWPFGSKPHSCCTLCDAIHVLGEGKGSSLRLSLYSFILLACCQYWPKMRKNHDSFAWM